MFTQECRKTITKNTPRLETFWGGSGAGQEPGFAITEISSQQRTVPDYRTCFPTLDCIMTGRGTLKNPALAREIRGGAPASKEEIRRFHDIMYNEYCEDLSGDRNILFRMKELWSYLAPMFTNNKNMPKRLRRQRNVWYMKMQSENYLAVNS